MPENPPSKKAGQPSPVNLNRIAPTFQPAETTKSGRATRKTLIVA
jgi:hypothetical protein